MAGIWVSENQYINFDEIERSSLEKEIASRSAAFDFDEIMGLLPDPDPVLTKHGGGVEILDALTSDGHLTSVMQTRKLGSLKKEYKFVPGTDENGKADAASEKLCNAFAKDMENLDLYNVVGGILDAPYYGYTPIEIIWEAKEGLLHVKELRCLPHRWFGTDEQNRFRFISKDNEEEGEEIPSGKMVFARHFPTYDNPYGLRLLSRCFWPVTFKKGGLKWWVKFLEKFGMPFLFGTYAQGTSPEEKQTLLNTLFKMVSDAVGIGPDGSTIQTIGGDFKGKGDLHKIFKDTMDAEVSKVIMGQTLTAEIGENGSYAASKTHEGVLAAYQQADQRLVQDTINKIAKYYSLVNSTGAPPQFVWFEEADPKKEFADRDKIISETGGRFTKKYFIRQYGYKDDEIDLTDQGQNMARNSNLEQSRQGLKSLQGNTALETKHGNFAQNPDFGDQVLFESQDSLDEFCEKCMGHIKPGLANTVIDIVAEAKTFDEVQDKSAPLDLSDEKFEELMANASFIADIWGRANV